jgi:hypothetical protein
MVNEFSGHIARHYCRIAALKNESLENNRDLHVLPYNTTKFTRPTNFIIVKLGV